MKRYCRACCKSFKSRGFKLGPDFFKKHHKKNRIKVTEDLCLTPFSQVTTSFGVHCEAISNTPTHHFYGQEGITSHPATFHRGGLDEGKSVNKKWHLGCELVLVSACQARNHRRGSEACMMQMRPWHPGLHLHSELRAPPPRPPFDFCIFSAFFFQLWKHGCFLSGVRRVTINGEIFCSRWPTAEICGLRPIAL